MAFYGSKYRISQQPGLEVAPCEYLRDENLYPNPQPRIQEEKQTYVDSSASSASWQHYYSEPTTPAPLHAFVHAPIQDPRPKKRRRCFFVIATAVGVAIIVGAVLGGVLGSRALDAAAAASTTSTPASTQTSSAPKAVGTAIKANSPLSVTGWRKTNGVEINVYYVGQDSKLRGSQYDSADAVKTNNSYWGSPTTFSTSITSGQTPVGGFTIIYRQQWGPQDNVYYLDGNSKLKGLTINPNVFPNFGDDSLNNNQVGVSKTSVLAAYFPYLGFQDSSGKLQVVSNSISSNFNYSPVPLWQQTNTGLKATTGTGIAIVPMSINSTLIIAKGGYGLVYQTTAGQLAISVPDQDTSSTSTQTHSWPSNVEFPKIDLPIGASIAAFATARANDTKGRVDTYILYQGADTKIHMVWLDNETAWKTSSPNAMAVADNGTDISCLTMPTSYLDPQEKVLLLEEASTDNRCYFQRNGALVEFALNGKDWIEMGTVPME